MVTKLCVFIANVDLLLTLRIKPDPHFAKIVNQTFSMNVITNFAQTTIVTEVTFRRFSLELFTIVLAEKLCALLVVQRVD